MSLPYFPMYPTDFEADTSHLTLEEDGAYNRLLRLMWITPGCSVPDDAAWIARRMRVDMVTYLRLIEPIMDEFCKRIGGRVVSPRLQREWKKADETSRLRSAAGKKGGRPQATEKTSKQEKPGLSPAKARPKQPEPYPEPDISEGKPSLSHVPRPSRFEEFWAVYPHRGGAKKGRKPAEAKYAAAVRSGALEQDIIDGARRSGNDRQVRAGFARDPATWLNQEGWNDEIDVSRGIGNGNANHNGQAESSGDRQLRLIAIAARSV